VPIWSFRKPGASRRRLTTFLDESSEIEGKCVFGGRGAHVRRRRRFDVLILRGDSARCLRLSVPRWAVFALAVTALVGLSALGLLVGDYLALRALPGDSAALHRELADRRIAAASFERRILEMRGEVESWRDTHGRIWSAFGPGDAARRGINGIGGAQTDSPAERGGSRSSGGDLDRLVGAISEEGQNLRALERLMRRAGRMLASLPSRWPLQGTINSEFGSRTSPWTGASEFHSGIDIGAPPGSPVHAPGAGVVAFAGAQGHYGLTVVLDHGDELRTLYAHLSRTAVVAEQKVQRGQLIGYSGNSGKTSGPHLHYEIALQGRPVNPRAYLWE